MREHSIRVPWHGYSAAFWRCVEVVAHCSKHRAKHLRRQHAGVGVVARAVIAREQRERADRSAAAMLEGRRRALGAERLHRRLMGDAAERHDDAQLLHFRDGGDEKFAAGVDLRRCRLVLRRHAAHAVGDAGVNQLKRVVGARLEGAAGETVFLHGGVEQIAGEVAGERPSGAVGAAQARGEADDQQARVERPERGHRRVEPRRLTRAPSLAKLREPRTERTVATRFGGFAGHDRELCGQAVPVAINPRNRRRRPHRRGSRRRRAALQELRRMLAFAARLAGHVAGRTLGRVAADLLAHLHDVGEDVGLPAQLVGHHRRLRRDGRNDRHPHAAALHRLDQRTEIAVAGEQHHVVDVGREFHGIDCELDIHVAFDLAAAGLVDEFLGGLGDDRIAVVVEPVDQRANRGIFLILDHSSVIKRPYQVTARLEFQQQPLVVDVEAQGFGGGVEICAVDEKCDFFAFYGHDSSLQMRFTAVTRRRPRHQCRGNGVLDRRCRDPISKMPRKMQSRSSQLRNLP